MTVPTLNRQVLNVEFLRTLTLKAQYSLMSAIRGPDATYTVGMAPLKTAFAQRFRAILFGAVADNLSVSNIPGNCAAGPMTSYRWNDMVDALKTVQGPGIYHFLSHIAHAMEAPAVRDHHIWDGKGDEIVELVKTAKARYGLDTDPKLKEAKDKQHVAETERRSALNKLGDLQRAVRNQHVATELVTKLIKEG